jgi:hypothetical protein
MQRRIQHPGHAAAFRAPARIHDSEIWIAAGDDREIMRV